MNKEANGPMARSRLNTGDQGVAGPSLTGGISKTPYPLLSYWFNPGSPVPT